MPNHLRPRAVVLCILSGCAVDTVVPDEAVVSCRRDLDCPPKRFCHPVLGTCEIPGADLVDIPRPVVSFVAPRQGETGIPVEPTLIIAFSMAVDSESLDGLVTLTRKANGQDIPLTQQATNEPNIFTFGVTEVLQPLSEHTIEVAAGVEPVESMAAPSEDVFQSTFETGQAPDVTPPDPVSNIVVDHRSSDRIELNWQNPTDTDGDFAGVLLVRRAGAPVTAVPTNGRTYAIGSTIGDSGESLVIASIQGRAWTDVTASAGQYDYALFAFDEDSNYAAAARVPFLRSFSLSWCTDERGTYTVDSPDTGDKQLEVTSTSGVPTGSGTLYPAAADPIGTTTTLQSGGGLALGQLNFVRPRLENSFGVYVGLETPFWASRATLTPIGVPAAVTPGGTASFVFEAGGWSEFEGEVDTDPTVDIESWSSAGVAVEIGVVYATVTTPGEYRFRARPVRTGCPTAPWTESGPVQTGAFLYVTPSGSGDGSGSDPRNTMDGVGAALDAAADGTDIRVAEGTYPEPATLLLRPTIRLFGGYNSTFTVRDPGSYDSIIDSADDRAIEAANWTVDDYVTVDGFVIQSGVSAQSQSEAIYIRTDASPTFSNNVIIPGPTLSRNTGFFLVSAGPARLESNTIIPVETAGAGTGISVSGGSGIVLIGNHIAARTGIYMTSNAEVTIEGNTIVPDGFVDIDTDGSGIACSGAGPVQIVNNRIRVATSEAGSTTVGIELSNCGTSTVDRNRIAAGGGTNHSRGIYVSSPTTTIITNNLVSAGNAVSFNRGLYCGQGTPIIGNNTFFVGETGATVFGIDAQSSCAPRITNNLFFGGTASWVGININTGSPPASLENNIWLGAPAVPYRQGYTDYSDISTVETMIASASLMASGNQVLSQSAGNVLNDLAGTDTDIHTLDDNDWRPQTNVDAVNNGGKDAGQDTCGDGTQSCGSVVVDYYGAARSAPFTVGAIEN